MKGEKSIMAKQSFCRKHTVGRLKFLPLGLLFMFFGIGCLYVGLHPDEGDPGYLRWVALGAGVFVVLIGLLECFLSLRDSRRTARWPSPSAPSSPIQKMRRR